VRKNETALAFFLHHSACQKNKEQRVIEHDYVRGPRTLARLLIKTARILAAGFLGANVRLTANLRPNFWIRLDGQIAQRTVPSSGGPIRQPLQDRCLTPGA